jgi:hypothetical protein
LGVPTNESACISEYLLNEAITSLFLSATVSTKTESLELRPTREILLMKQEEKEKERNNIPITNK